MATILFHDIIFGPVQSRRLGVSLGVNLLPTYGKWCNFDCVYCECGFNKDGRDDRKLPTAEDVAEIMRQKLVNHDLTIGKIDTITFSGNGEPTMHPSFSQIIDNTIFLRDSFAAEAKISVLSNGSMLDKKDLIDALMKIDNAIIKIDSAFDSTVEIIDRPQYNYSVEKVVSDLAPLKGKYVLQTMFLRGRDGDVIIDNTTEEEINGWYKIAERTSPRQIMIYTIDRETPMSGLEKVSVEEMEQIAAPLRAEGFNVSVSG